MTFSSATKRKVIPSALVADEPVSLVPIAPPCHHNDEKTNSFRLLCTTPSSSLPHHVSHDCTMMTTCPAIPQRSFYHQCNSLVDTGAPCLPLLDLASATSKHYPNDDSDDDLCVRIPPKKLPSDFVLAIMKTFNYDGPGSKEETPGSSFSSHFFQPINLDKHSTVTNDDPMIKFPTSAWPLLPADLSSTQGINDDNEELFTPPSKRMRMRPSSQRCSQALFHLDYLE